jgi:hypothetical protein
MFLAKKGERYYFFLEKTRHKYKKRKRKKAGADCGNPPRM